MVQDDRYRDFVRKQLSAGSSHEANVNSNTLPERDSAVPGFSVTDELFGINETYKTTKPIVVEETAKNSKLSIIFSKIRVTGIFWFTGYWVYLYKFCKITTKP